MIANLLVHHSYAVELYLFYWIINFVIASCRPFFSDLSFKFFFILSVCDTVEWGTIISPNDVVIFGVEVLIVLGIIMEAGEVIIVLVLVLILFIFIIIVAEVRYSPIRI